MIVVLLAAAVSVVVLIVCVPLPSLYEEHNVGDVNAKVMPLDENGNVLGGPISIHVGSLVIRTSHTRSRWLRWRDAF